MHLNIFFLSSLVATSDAFLIFGRHLVQSRLDPIVNAGKVSGHLHTVVGGSAFSQDYSFPTYKNAKCSTIEVQADKSNYWIPSVMAKHPNGTYSSLPVHETRIYYFNRGNAQAFPDGLRMLVGDPNARTPSNNWIGFTCQQGSTNGVKNGPEVHLPGFPPYVCHDFLRTELNFPSCWDGVNLDSPDHKSHMTFRSGSKCPASHPVMLPEISLEIGFRTKDYPYTALMLSTGDKTGYGLHADFANGWDRNVLQAAMNDPTCNDRQNIYGDGAQCEALKAFRDTKAAESCRLEGNIPQEEVGIGKPLKQLPGCNLEWFASEGKPTCSVTPPTPLIGPPSRFFNFNNKNDVNAKPEVPIPIYDGFNAAPAPMPTTTLITSTVQSVTTPPPAITKVYIYLCTDPNWSGTCQNWEYVLTTSCKSFQNTVFMNRVGSAGPDKGRCQLYSDPHCQTKLGDSFPYPGKSSFGADSTRFQSVKCFAS